MKELEKFNADTTPLGTQLITRDGREVSEWYYFKTAEAINPIVAVLEKTILSFKENGEYPMRSGGHNDLFIKPKVKECWVNVYRNLDGSIFTSGNYSIEDAAKKDIHNVFNFIKTIRITDEQ